MCGGVDAITYAPRPRYAARPARCVAYGKERGCIRIASYRYDAIYSQNISFANSLMAKTVAFADRSSICVLCAPYVERKLPFVVVFPVGNAENVTPVAHLATGRGGCGRWILCALRSLYLCSPRPHPITRGGKRSYFPFYRYGCSLRADRSGFCICGNGIRYAGNVETPLPPWYNQRKNMNLAGSAG